MTHSPRRWLFDPITPLTTVATRIKAAESLRLEGRLLPGVERFWKLNRKRSSDIKDQRPPAIPGTANTEILQIMVEKWTGNLTQQKKRCSSWYSKNVNEARRLKVLLLIIKDSHAELSTAHSVVKTISRCSPQEKLLYGTNSTANASCWKPMWVLFRNTSNYPYTDEFFYCVERPQRENPVCEPKSRKS